MNKLIQVLLFTLLSLPLMTSGMAQMSYHVPAPAIMPDRPAEAAPEYRKPTAQSAPINNTRYVRRQAAVAEATNSQKPVDYEIHGTRGELIKVHFEKLLAPETPDRCDIAFCVSGDMREVKTFVFGGAETFSLSGTTPGPARLTKRTGYDYVSFDNARPIVDESLRRDDAYNQRVVTPQTTQWQLAFYHGKTMKKESRVKIKTTTPLLYIYNNDARETQEFMAQFWPGYQITFTWVR